MVQSVHELTTGTNEFMHALDHDRLSGGQNRAGKVRPQPARSVFWVSCPCAWMASGAGEMMNRKNAVDEARGNTSTGADAASGPVERFLALVREAIGTRTLQRLVLSRPARMMLPPGFVDEGPVLQRVRIRPVRLRGGVKLAFGWQYDTRDQTDNLPLDERRRCA